MHCAAQCIIEQKRKSSLFILNNIGLHTAAYRCQAEDEGSDQEN